MTSSQANTNLFYALLGTRREDLPVALFDDSGRFVGTQSADEYNGIIDGECVVGEVVKHGRPYSRTLPARYKDNKG